MVSAVPHLGLAHRKTGKDVSRNADDLDAPLADQLLDPADLGLAQVTDFLVPQVLQFGMTQAMLQHHVQRVLKFPADAVSDYT